MILRRRVHLVVALAFAVILAMSFAGVLRPSSQAAAYSGVSVSIQNPSFAGKSETVVVTVIIVGGPAADIGGNYTYRDVKMTGTNTTDWKVDPISQTSESGVFKFNLTMPGEAGQTVKVTLNATSTEWRTNQERYTSADFEIKVVDPIVITAKVFNTGVVDVVNATAHIYADGLLLDTQVINVTAGSSQTITYNWTFSSIRSGKHVVTVKVDDPNGLVEFSDGNNEYTLTIYVGEQGNPTGAVLTVGLIIVIVLFVLTYLQKPIKRGKKA
jgi:hypothetical protein